LTQKWPFFWPPLKRAKKRELRNRLCRVPMSPRRNIYYLVSRHPPSTPFWPPGGVKIESCSFAAEMTIFEVFAKIAILLKSCVWSFLRHAGHGGQHHYNKIYFL
jgi:hypothetical protein